jgi:hypothetical protein
MSLLEGEGVSRDLISALAGHSGKTVTDRHYIAKNIDRFNEVVLKLPIPNVLPWVPDPIDSRGIESGHTNGATVNG